jgi:inner membrane protein
VARLRWHRGPSHAWWAALLGALLWAPAIRWMHRRSADCPRFRAVFIGATLVFVTHVLIDVFTVYGTQVLAPFSRHGFQTGNLFIIDPLYTLPLLVGAGLALVLPSAGARRRANFVGLALSTLYVGWSFVAQAGASRVFAAELTRQGHPVVPGRTLTTATPLNTILWRHLAEVDGGFLIGYWSWRDADRQVCFEFVPRGGDALSPTTRTSRAFGAVAWFTQDYWLVLPLQGDSTRLKVVDLRFNEVRLGPNTPPAQWHTPFAWEFPAAMSAAAGAPPLRPLPTDFGDPYTSFTLVWRRLKGDREAW